jgi:putative acetyltransferase
MIIAKYSEKDAEEIASLFHRTVHAIDSSIYSEKEKEAWAPTPPDYPEWAEKLRRKKPYMACEDGKIIGFMNMGSDGHIDYAYIAPEYQGKGVGKFLYEHIEEIARKRSIRKLSVEASKLAMPFFKKVGFNLLHENHIIRNGETLVNYTMLKEI